MAKANGSRDPAGVLLSTHDDSFDATDFTFDPTLNPDDHSMDNCFTAFDRDG
jgi:hypothetical protein